MQPLWRRLCGIQRCVNSTRSLPLQFSKVFHLNPSCCLSNLEHDLPSSWRGMTTNILQHPTSVAMHNWTRFVAYREHSALPTRVTLPISTGLSLSPGLVSSQADGVRHLTTISDPEKAVNEDRSVASTDTLQPQRIKFKRLDKTARHIMNILDKEEVEKVRTNREIPDIKPGYIVQLKVVVPENKRRVSILKGIVIARRNAGLHTTFRLRRMVAGVGVESVFPLYSPNIKEMKVLDKKDVRRAKLYYLRDRMNALKQK